MERLQASLYILLYTFLASIPFFIFILKYYIIIISINFYYIFYLTSKIIVRYWWIFISLVFIVKIPIYLVHLWLPKAHVEAPLAGSIILAGVLLKLGGYGFFKILYFIYLNLFKISYIFISIAVLRSFLVSFICIRQVDLKCLVAYSSIVHIGPILLSLIRFYWVRWIGSFFIILSHGLCSSCIFYLLNYIYERWRTRRSLIIRGGLISFPIFSFWWFSIRAANISRPPSFNFLSEILIFISCFNYRFSLLYLFSIILLISGFYSIYFFIIFNHGIISFKLILNFIIIREILILLSHTFPLFFIFLLINQLIN